MDYVKKLQFVMLFGTSNWLQFVPTKCYSIYHNSISQRRKYGRIFCTPHARPGWKEI